MIVACASDAHGARDALHRMIDLLPQVDAFCYLGDRDADGDLIEALLSQRQPAAAFFAVAGNNDLISDRALTVETELSRARALLTHGHLFGVKQSPMRLLYAAKERGRDLALFGHTHEAYSECVDGVWLVNPGALFRGRWALIEIGDALCVRHMTT